MANELKHIDVGTELTKTEWEAGATHTIDGAEQGDILYYNGTAIVKLVHGNSGNLLQSGGDSANPSWVDHVGAADPHTGYVLESLYDADSVVTATSDNTPIATAMAEQTVLGRLTGGHPDDIAIGIANDNIVQIDDASVADDDFARFTASGIEGLSTQTTLSTLLGAVMLENDALKLDAALSADGKWNGITRTGTAGATLAFGDLVYLAVADSRWELADTDAAATIQGLLGICVLAAASDGDATNILLIGTVRADTAFPALTVGAPVFASSTAGDITSTLPAKSTGRCVRVVGQAWTADELWFCPSPDWIEYA